MSETLRARDLRTVIDVAQTIGEAEDLDAFRAAALALAPKLVAGDVYGYNEVPPRRAEPLVSMSDTPASDAWRDALVRLAEEHPLVVHYIGTGDPEARAISDLLSRREYENGEFYRDVLSHAGGRDQLAVSIPGEDGLCIGLAVNRERRGFSERDHAVYDAVRPFLLWGYRNTSARRRDQAVISALGAAADAVEQSVVLVGPMQRVAHVTPGTAELLGGRPVLRGARLCEPLAGWVREQRGRSTPVPLALDAVTARFVRDVDDELDAIVLTPADRGLSAPVLRRLGLTSREAEVMALVAEGLTNAATGARLDISERTVAKHLQHVNEKLGVASRTAAVARLRELIADRN